MLKAVIVDDETKAIKSLLWELSQFKENIEVLKTFNKPEEALIYLESADIDCLFLDIEMPTMDGFQFIEKLINKNNKNFAIVITTAYNQYAVEALKKEAIDYLLKPIDSDDLKECLIKIEKHAKKTSQFEMDEKLEEILVSFNKNLKQKKVIINTDGKLLFLDTSEILFVESDGNYSSIYTTSNKKIVLTKKLKEVNLLLPSHEFFRIHNSYVINLNKIKEFYKTDGYVIIEGSHKIPVSRQKKSEFLDQF